MKHWVKLSLIVAASLICSGIIIGGLGWSSADWDMGPGEEYVRRETSFPGEEIDIIRTDCAVSDISVTQSEGDTITLAYYDGENQRYRVGAEGGELSIRYEDSRKWYDHIHFFWFESKAYTVEIGIPANYDGELELYTSTGNIRVGGVSLTGSLSLSATTGDLGVSDTKSGGDVRISATTGAVKLSDTVSGGNVSLSATTGDIHGSGILQSGPLSVSVSSGDIDLVNIKGADEVKISSTIGDIRFTGIDAESFRVVASTGSIRFENIRAEKGIALSATTGDISGAIADSIESFSITSSAAVGDNNLPASLSLGDILLDVHVTTGEISIEFAE
jgi:DUF4097 and DUF4098 domain-containing protein YvlB